MGKAKVERKVKAWAVFASGGRVNASHDKWLACQGMGIGGEEAPASCAVRVLIAPVSKAKPSPVTPKAAGKRKVRWYRGKLTGIVYEALGTRTREHHKIGKRSRWYEVDQSWATDLYDPITPAQAAAQIAAWRKGRGKS